jgi:hypothetical protein
MVTHDVLVGGANLYPLGVTLDFGEEITHCRPRWQTKNNCKDFFLVIFNKGKVRKSNKSTMLVGFSRLPLGFDLLEGNIQYYDIKPPSIELEMLKASGRPFIKANVYCIYVGKCPTFGGLSTNYVGSITLNSGLD